MARGTRISEGKNSGTTIATVPSGVTMDANGIHYSSSAYITPAELGKLDAIDGYPLGYATAGSQISAGRTAWAGVSVSLAHGFTTLTSLVATHYDKLSGVSFKTVHISYTIPGSVSAAVYGVTSGAASLVEASGGTITWIAIGT